MDSSLATKILLNCLGLKKLAKILEQQLLLCISQNFCHQNFRSVFRFWIVKWDFYQIIHVLLGNCRNFQKNYLNDF